MTVNGVDVSRSPLTAAVAAIKCADKGDCLFDVCLFIYYQKSLE